MISIILSWHRRLRHFSLWMTFQLKALIIRHWPITRGPRHTLPGEFIVSLTSYPPRFGTLDLVLRALLSQDMAPDKVVLWIAHADMAGLPKRVLALQASGLIIRECADIKAAKKILPCLVAYPDAFILTADDDIVYPTGWLRRFVEAYREPGEILCQRARRIAFHSASALAPYVEWPNVSIPASDLQLFPVGFAGILYPPHSLASEVLNVEQMSALAPDNDDIWLYWMGKRAGSRHRAIGLPHRLFNLPNRGGPKLWAQNRYGGNDRQIKAMIGVYGLPFEYSKASG